MTPGRQNATYHDLGDRILDLVDFHLAEALDLEEGPTRRGMNGLYAQSVS